MNKRAFVARVRVGSKIEEITVFATSPVEALQVARDQFGRNNVLGTPRIA